MPTANSQDYVYWYAALAGKRPPVHEGSPQCGYYAAPLRGRSLNGSSRYPVAIFRDDQGALVALHGYQMGAERVDPITIWLGVAAHPITEAFYERAFADGRFPDDLPAEALARPRAPSADGADLPNAAKVSDLEALADQVDAAAMAAAVSVENDEQAAKAQSVRARLNELANAADKLRKGLKEPHLRAGQAVDEAWNPIIQKAKAAAAAIANRISGYLTVKSRREREAAEAAEKAQREAALAAEAGVTLPAPEPAPVPPPPPRTTVKGGYGRAAAIIEVKVAAIADVEAFASYLIAHKDEQLLAWLTLRAQALVNAGAVGLPGVTTTDEKKVR